MDLSYTYLDAGGYIKANALGEFQLMLSDYGFSLQQDAFDNEKHLGRYYYELKIESNCDLVFGFTLTVIRDHPHEAYDISLEGCSILTEYEFGFLMKLREFIAVNQWNPELTAWRFFVGGKYNEPVRVVRSSYNRCLRVLLESKWIMSNLENALRGIETIHSIAVNGLNEDHMANRPRRQEYLDMLHFEASLLYQQEVMIFGGFDGFCHQLSIAMLMDKKAESYKTALNRVRYITFKEIKCLEHMITPIEVEFEEDRDVIDKDLKCLFEQRNKKVHRAVRDYESSMKTVEKELRLVNGLLNSVIKAFWAQFSFEAGYGR